MPCIFNAKSSMCGVVGSQRRLYGRCNLVSIGVHSKKVAEHWCYKQCRKPVQAIECRMKSKRRRGPDKVSLRRCSGSMLNVCYCTGAHGQLYSTAASGKHFIGRERPSVFPVAQKITVQRRPGACLLTHTAVLGLGGLMHTEDLSRPRMWTVPKALLPVLVLTEGLLRHQAVPWECLAM